MSIFGRLVRWYYGDPCERCGLYWHEHPVVGRGYPPIRHCTPPMPEPLPLPEGWSIGPAAPLAPVLLSSGMYLQGDVEIRTFVVIQVPAPPPDAIWTTLYGRVVPYGEEVIVAQSACEYQARVDGGECGATYEFTARCRNRYGIEGPPSQVLSFTAPIDVYA